MGAALGAVLSLLSGAVSLGGKFMDWLGNKQKEDAGAAKQKAADREQTDKDEEAARAAQNKVAAAGDVELDRLRDRWTKP